MDSMDSSHPHSHASHERQASIHLQPQTEAGEYDASADATAPQTIEIPADSGHSVTSGATTPGYGYHQSTTPSSPAPAKRSNESKPASDLVYPNCKRIRVDDSTPPASPANCPIPASTTPGPESSPSECVADRLSNRFKPSGSKPPYRSRSLPATLRKRRRNHESLQQHLPPVTLSTLRELDLSEIYRNPKLRHDVVFDAQLHFRPNLDGSRGRRKREQADIYWKLVLHECEMLFANVRNRQARVAGMAVKLPTLFKTMKDILSTLVPKSDREDVEAALDHIFLMQQLEHGVLDFKKLSEWLARVLKAHCAPMRDQWVEQMVARVAYGVDNGKISALVDGLKMVFGILEAMKLDVANHQIRTLRPHLVSTAVHFEQGYFEERIQSGRLDMREPRSWFQNALKADSDPYICFIRATTEMLAPSKYATYPATFTFDFERLDGIRDDIREATCLKLAVIFFRQLVLPSKRDIDAATIDRLRVEVLAILSEEEGPNRWHKGSNAVALHIAQTAHQFNGHAGLVDAKNVAFAEGWFQNQLRTDSRVYGHVEQEVIKDITALVLQAMKSWSSLSTSPIMQAADLTGSSVELAAIAQKISHIAFLHWRIFGKLYISA